MWRRLCALIMVCCMVLTGCQAASVHKYKNDNHQALTTQEEVAESTPLGKYPETVTYSLGKMTGSDNSNMPEGDTYEDNAYTRFLKKKLNIQNKDAFEVAENDNYDSNLSMVVASKNIPDILVVNDMNTLQTLVKNDMIEDLTDVYDKCTSSRIKSIYNSYGNEMLENVTFNGKLMALPETNIDNGPSLLWLRKDWMDKLGLKAPKTINDARKIIKEFIEKDPGGNGSGNTIGLVSTDSLTAGCGYTAEYQTDIIFASFGAFPKQWIKDSDGNVVYGSVQPEAKKALAYLHKMYKAGILDKDFLLRGNSNIIDLIVSGKCGSFFGPWWAPNNPLMNSEKSDPDADWQPYLLQTDSDGNTSYASQNPSYKYVVVRKGYKHPEIVMKIVSALFDGAKYGSTGYGEIETYYQKNVDPTARPLAINVDYKDALYRCYTALKNTINRKYSLTDLGLLEGSYDISCERYLRQKENSSNTSLEDWAAYTSRISACSVMHESNTKEVKSLFFGETKTMKSQWWKLEELEKEAYLQIVTGQKPISYFDEFVKNWEKQYGSQITNEVADEVK